MLCTFCQYLDYDLAEYESGVTKAGVAGSPHHASYHDLIVSASNGCELCLWVEEARITTHVAEPEAKWKDLQITRRLTWLNELQWFAGDFYITQFNLSTTYGEHSLFMFNT